MSKRKGGDFGYRATEIKQGYAQRAMREAVLGPVVDAGTWTHHNIPQMLELLRSKWYARLNTLKEVGWPPVEDDKAFQYMRNCPPFGVSTEDVGRRCKRRFCPFCWARDTVSVIYDRVLAACCIHEVLRDDLHLVEFSLGTYWSRRHKFAHWPAIRQRFQERRRCEVDQVPHCLGAVVFQVVVPTKDRIYYRRRGLILVGQGDPASIESPTAKVVRHEKLSRQGIADAIVRVCKYPPGLLRMPPERLIEMLDNMGSTRWLSHYGAFRNTKGGF